MLESGVMGAFELQPRVEKRKKPVRRTSCHLKSCAEGSTLCLSAEGTADDTWARMPGTALSRCQG